MSFQGAVRSFSVWLGGDGGWMAGIDELSGSCVHSLLVGWAVLVAGWLGLMSFQGAVVSLQAGGFSHM